METGEISNAHVNVVNASSEYDSHLGARHGRLHGLTAWSADTRDVNQWLQIDLGGNHHTVTRVATQGQGDDFDEWVTIYKIKHSNDEVSFHY